MPGLYVWRESLNSRTNSLENHIDGLDNQIDSILVQTLQSDKQSNWINNLNNQIFSLGY